GRLGRALGDAKRRLMEDEGDAGDYRGYLRGITQIALDDRHGSSGASTRQVLMATATEVVEHDDFGRPLLLQLINDVRADQTCSARDEDSRPPEVFHRELAPRRRTSAMIDSLLARCARIRWRCHQNRNMSR